MKAGWTASFLFKLYPELSLYMIKEFVRATTKVSTVVILALFKTFGAENFQKKHAVLLTEGIQNLHLDGLLTMIVMTYGKLGEYITLTRYPEQMRECLTKFDLQRATASWIKMRDLRHTLIHFLLQQNLLGAGKDETIQRKEDVRRHAGGMPLLIGLCLAMRIDALVLIRGVSEIKTVI